MPLRSISSLLCALALLAGCAQPTRNVLFVTKASLGIDADVTAQSASFAYDRTEGYFAPRYTNQDPPAVLASVSTDGGIIDRKIRQVYATGNAAKIVSSPSAPAVAPLETTQQALFRKASLEQGPSAPAVQPVYPGAPSEPARSMFFGTATVLGLKVQFSPALIEGLTLGFKRKEFSVIPQDPNESSFPSVIASFDADTSASASAGKALPQASMGAKQFFATGAAADGLAANTQIRSLFQNEAADRLAAYRDNERHIQNYALLSLACLTELDDTQAQKVWTNVSQLKLFDPAGVTALQSAASPSAARSVYTREMVIANVDATEAGLMHAHQVYVCSLRKPT
jgi:hypothetical protein